MRKVMFTVLFVLSCTSLAPAQDDYHKIEVFGGYSRANVDGFVGDELRTSLTAVNNSPATRERSKLNGFDASVTYNFSRYVGAKFAVSGHYNSNDQILLPSQNFIRPSPPFVFVVPGTVVDTRRQHYTFLGGVQIKDNSKETRIKPFAHALFGAARQNTKLDLSSDVSRTIIYNGRDRISSNSFAMAFGGGLDIRVSRRISIRAIQFDYNPTFLKEQTIVSQGEQRVFPFVLNGTPLTVNESVTTASRRQDNFRIGVGIVFH